MSDHKGLTDAQIAWAEQHDWFRWVHTSQGLRGVVVYSAGMDEREFFTDYTKLRNWAGY